MNERSAFERLLDILDQVITKAGSIHAAPHEFGTGTPLFKTEIHTIRVIGQNRTIRVTELAERMGVTKGAVSQTVNKLVRKKLVRKRQAADDAREVLLELTDLGWVGFRSHEQFHMDMFDTVRAYFGDRLKSRVGLLVIVLEELNEMLDRYLERDKQP